MEFEIVDEIYQARMQEEGFEKCNICGEWLQHVENGMCIECREENENE